MKFTRALSIALWIAVLIAGFIVLRNRINSRNADRVMEGGIVMIDENGNLVNAELEPDAVTLVDMPWKRLPDVPDFRLTNQAGEEFDSRKNLGKTYALYFFFTTCPTICRDLNRQIANLNERLKDTEIQFVGVSVDPEVDTPEVLARYAEDYDAVPPRWQMLTGQMYRIKQLGEHGLNVVIAKSNHTDNIFLVDKWGRFRDRFRWNQESEHERFIRTANEVSAENEPPLNDTVMTRQVQPTDWKTAPWIRDFRFVDSESQEFHSRDMTGQVWVASFFFTRCPGICQEQNKYLAGLIQRTRTNPFPILSVTTDPDFDTPEVLGRYASGIGADLSRWRFVTGEKELLRRASGEYFGVTADGEHHSTELIVIDRWHRVRGKFSWQNPEDEARMLKLIDELKQEKMPLPASSK